MARVIFLGNWSLQTADTDTTNYLVEVGDTRILVDGGPGVVKQLEKAGIDVTSINLIIITHRHGDHALGVPYFLFADYFKRRMQNRPLEPKKVITLPEVHIGIIESVRFFFPQVFAAPDFKIEEMDADPVAEKRFELNNVVITTFPVTHAVPTIGFRIQAGGKTIVFTSDTSYDNRIVSMAKGCDLLVHEGMGTLADREFLSRTGHSVAEDAGRAAGEAGAKMLAVCHLMPKYLGKKNLFMKEASSKFNGKILIPDDLEVLDV